MRTAPPALAERFNRRRFLAPFAGQLVSPPPLWLMRQAGRYLPEYWNVRARAAGFLDLCYTPELAAEVTLQPIRRYGFDAAILFSDILVVPNALGQDVEFVEREGPRLDPIHSAADLLRLDPRRTKAKFDRIFEAVDRVRGSLPQATALIGFCGAPWTVATYMVAGQATPDQADARLWAYRDPDGFGRLIELLTAVSIEYLSGQIAAGADAVQIFDSWVGSLPDTEFHRWVVLPTEIIVRELKVRHNHVPVIGFPRGAGVKTAQYAAATGVDGIGCDTSLPLEFMRSVLARDQLVLQGNLDPLLLIVGGRELESRVRQILTAMAGIPFIFNLGHGIVPQTPPAHVARLVELVRGARVC
jgi:uroporphyrinogen decarboxylase